MNPDKVINLLEIANTVPPNKYGNIEICKTTIARAIITIEQLQIENEKLKDLLQVKTIVEVQTMSIEKFVEMLLAAIPKNAEDSAVVSIDALFIRRAAEILLRQSADFDKQQKKIKKLKKKNKDLQKQVNALTEEISKLLKANDDLRKSSVDLGPGKPCNMG